MPNAEADACNQVHAWDTGGQDPDQFDEAVAQAQDRLSAADDGPLADAVVTLAGSSADEQVDNAEALLTVCVDQGWELPEG
jgi:hypothetical protein